MKHIHQTFEVITKYYKDKPAKVMSAKCPDCGEENKKLKELEQERQDKIFEMYDNKSPYVWWGKDQVRYMQKLIDAKNPHI